MEKRDYQLIAELDNVFAPQDFGVITNAEIQLVRSALQLDARDGLSLCNLRDMVVMYYHIKTLEDGFNRVESDKMSAITYVIDNAKVDRGLEP